MSPRGRFEGFPVLVTGGGTGIGKAIALRFAAEGAVVAVSGRRPEPLEEVCAEGSGNGGRLHAFPCDVTDRDAVEEMVSEVTEVCGPPRILVNNAGLGGPNACSREGPDRWREILSVNLDGLFHVTRAVLRVMPERGRILSISSVLGKFGVPGYTAYCASKHGVVGFTRALALEVADRGITVNAVCPGWVETEMAKAGMEDLAKGAGITYEEARASALGQVPLKRILEPAEIAGLVAWIASEEAAGMTGQAVNLSGGSAVW